MFKQFLYVAGAVAMWGTVSAQDPVIFISAFTAGDAGAIHAYGFDDQSGQLTLKHRTTDLNNPFFLAVSPDNKFLYAIDAEKFGGEDDELVAAYQIPDRSGRLVRLNQQSAKGTASCYLDVDSTGKMVVVANYSTGSVAALPVQPDGSLNAAASFVQHSGSSVNAARQKAPYAHSIVISPDNRFALAADLGIDKVLVYQVDAQAATLTPHASQPSVELPPGSGPRHLTFHPNGRRVYVINELLNTVSFFGYEADSGRLTLQQTISTVPEDFSGVSHTADLKITPDGRFLYGTNRGHDSIAIYQIQEDGRLKLVSIDPSLGKGPQNLLITDNGRWLLCANMPGNNVIVFAIDAKSGALTATGNPVSMPMPSCIRGLK